MSLERQLDANWAAPCPRRASPRRLGPFFNSLLKREYCLAQRRWTPDPISAQTATNETGHDSMALRTIGAGTPSLGCLVLAACLTPPSVHHGSTPSSSSNSRSNSVPIPAAKPPASPIPAIRMPEANRSARPTSIATEPFRKGVKVASDSWQFTAQVHEKIPPLRFVIRAERVAVHNRHTLLVKPFRPSMSESATARCNS